MLQGFCVTSHCHDVETDCRLVMYKWKLRQRKFCLTQAELVKSYEGPDFDLADRYGEVSLANTSVIAYHDGMLPAV